MKLLNMYGFIILLPISPMVAAADIGDEDNLSYLQATVKHKSQREVKGSECYLYVEINGNRDWEELKEELNTIIESNSTCKSFTIFKTIKNVDTVEESQDLAGYDYNLGVIVQDSTGGKDIHSTTLVENSNITTGFFDSTINAGIDLGDDDQAIFLQGNTIKNTTIIENSAVGNTPFPEFNF